MKFFYFLESFLTLSSILFLGFGIYSLLLLLFRPFISQNFQKQIETFDDSACILIAFIGTMNLLTIIVKIFLFRDIFKDFFEHKSLLNNLLVYAVLPIFVQFIFYVFSQLLWLIKLRKLFIIRLLLGLCLLVSTEKIVIYLLIDQRDYLPSTWSIPFYQHAIQWISSFIRFGIIALIFHWIRRRIILKKTIDVHESD